MTQLLQIAVVPYKASIDKEEVLTSLEPAIQILHKTKGLLAHWQGEKYEELRVLVWILLWEDYASYEAFFTSAPYGEFTKILDPILFGRKIRWDLRAFVRPGSGGDLEALGNIVSSPAIEVATTVVVDGKVHGYLNEGFAEAGPLMAAQPGFQGAFVAPSVEDPQRICLLINWKSFEAHHKDFENTEAFTTIISRLSEYYGQFVVPWHIVRNKLLFGGIPGKG
ncbi:hypothetical protein NX059_005761 [Plenodomus lindquistii]|nr:hypothetical protein NX059_005761 [Plenodomus lindquistii]